jgi:hypothetical protein
MVRNKQTCFMKSKLLTRDEFREGVFSRDGHKCVICGEAAQDAHHIMERRLFSDGGYYLENGASLCGKHHIMAEETILDCDDIRQAAGIESVLLPEHLYADQEYDKWGNPVIANGQRLKGELFYDESVQKILAQGDVLHHFSKYVKYPRSYHTPWSDKVTKDDKVLPNDDHFLGKDVVVTLKMDGENTSFYNDYVHARSINSGSHPTRNKVKEIWSRVGYQLSEDERICGENLYAKHSIEYTDLPSYFMVFSWWDGNTCLSWDETVFNAQACDLEVVPVVYRGMYDRDIIHKMYEQNHAGPTCEGYVIRLASEFTYGEFRRSLMKYVDPAFREKVNQSHGHWISQKITANKLRNVNI